VVGLAAGSGIKRNEQHEDQKYFNGFDNHKWYLRKQQENGEITKALLLTDSL
jgi:hypothetical protein